MSEVRALTTLRWNHRLRASIFGHPLSLRAPASISKSTKDELNAFTRASRSSLWNLCLNFEVCPQHFASKEVGGTHASDTRYLSTPMRNNARGIAYCSRAPSWQQSHFIPLAARPDCHSERKRSCNAADEAREASLSIWDQLFDRSRSTDWTRDVSLHST